MPSWPPRCSTSRTRPTPGSRGARRSRPSRGARRRWRIRIADALSRPLDFLIDGWRLACEWRPAMGRWRRLRWSLPGLLAFAVLHPPPLAASGIITTIAGGGNGEGLPALGQALLPRKALNVAGAVLVVDEYTNHRIHRIDAVTGILTTFAGQG